MNANSPTRFALAIHGGAGNITPENLPSDQEQSCRETLTDVLRAGYALLSQGRSSLDVVEAMVRSLEDFPLFNAGRGHLSLMKARRNLMPPSWMGPALWPVRLLASQLSETLSPLPEP